MAAPNRRLAARSIVAAAARRLADAPCAAFPCGVCNRASTQWRAMRGFQSISAMGRSAGLGLVLVAAGCVAPTPRGPAPAVRPPVQPVRPTYNAAGLEGVMGRNARMLESEFGKPDLELREGTARKLQFAGAACVLDLYLYPPRGGGEPVVTYVDARLPDGRDFDRASCVAALTRKHEAD